MQWFSQAPANIALIKYMGKIDHETNEPANASLSYTLPHLQSHVVLESTDTQDSWEPLSLPGLIKPIFNEHAKTRFLKHLTLIKKHFGYDGYFKVRSANNFPHGTGLASSASSFAALTQCAVQACCELMQIKRPTIEAQAALSRQGSGSSCRSFFAPWALWETTTARAVTLPYSTLIHQVILIDTDEKKVSSSEAHQRIKTSPLYAERPVRAQHHLEALLKALHAQQWHDAYQICWQEFQDMHALFTSSNPSFTYMNAQTNAVLDKINHLWHSLGDGPLITMDAGPNIHLLYRPDQQELAIQFKHEFFNEYVIL